MNLCERIQIGYKGELFIPAIERILERVLPQEYAEEFDYHFFERLPFFCWTEAKKAPCELSFFMLCHFRANAFRFFYEMISRWLIPGKRLNALLQFATDFSFPTLGRQKFIAAEVMVSIESEADLATLKKNLPIIESEIRMGLESYYQACRILEIKGLTHDEKTAFIQENIVSLIKHRPQDFDYDILSEMQHFLVLCKEEFKQARGFRHMSRIICVHYLFRKALKLSLQVYQDRRYIYLKLIRAKLHGNTKVLGLAIGMSFLKDNERLEVPHIMSSVAAIVPEASYVEGSFFCNQSRSDPTLTLYLEIQKEEGFSLEEERLLKDELTLEIKNHIEQRLNPIFMPQNEESIMRHVVALSYELRYLRDLPQVVIDFTQQTEDKLEFLVVALRVAKPNLVTIAHCIENRLAAVEYIHDRTHLIGWPRKKYRKEASVFRLRIDKKPFLRRDHSVNLKEARQKVALELKKAIGEFRDYNGGMISKENELFDGLRKDAAGHAFLLENFFYSLNPPIMRSILPEAPLKTLFSMIVEQSFDTLSNEAPYQISMQYDERYMHMVMIAKDEKMVEALAPLLKLFSGRIASCFLHHQEVPCFGLIFLDPDAEEALRLRLHIEQALAETYAGFAFN